MAEQIHNEPWLASDHHSDMLINTRALLSKMGILQFHDLT